MTWGYFKASAGIAGAFLLLTQPAAAQSAGRTIQQEAINRVVQTIIQSVRDQVHDRKLVAPSGPLGFAAGESEFDSRNPFATQDIPISFSALAYAKAPPAAPGSSWLYGANLTGADDESKTAGISTSIATTTGAFDVTKIGVFTMSDTLTFIASGSNAWSHQHGPFSIDNTTPSVSGTLSYSNSGFSVDFTSFVSWTRSTFQTAPAIVVNGNLLGYTANTQYRFDLPSAVFIEPTIGMTYTEGYTANFGTKVSDTTEVHGGARVGATMPWMGYTVQPTLSALVSRTVDSSAAGFPGPIVPAGVIGFQGSARVTVIWTPNFSSFVEAHATGMTGPSVPTLGYNTTRTVGAQAGLRYSWN
ncbi:MAG: autotransporter domain-containing protein [Rhizobiales bacterium]|nr:autotransporter domain-containing protein [Hyphomicrobiales bacterium]